MADAARHVRDREAHGTEALLRDAAVLIAWQHQDIPGISQSILTQTRTPPPERSTSSKTWPTDRRGAARYDLVFVFDRRAGYGPIEKFPSRSDVACW